MRITTFVLALAAASCSAADVSSPPAAPPTPAASVVTTIAVTLASSSVEAGTTTAANAALTDQRGLPVAGKTVTWTTDNPLVATVSAGGIISAVAPGTTSVAATADGKQGQAVITVTRSTKFVLDATVFSTADFGGATGALADVTVLPLVDGRFRMFLGAAPGLPGLRSAISTDGVKFTMEPGSRSAGAPIPPRNLPSGATHPYVMRLDDGRVRLYATGAVSEMTQGGARIFSMTSTDEGMTFTPEDGTRVFAEPGTTISGPCIVKAKGGGWRMYYGSTSLTERVFGLTVAHIGSAFSTDLLTWVVDPGVRVGPGAATITGFSDHPGCVVNDDGSMTLVYWRDNVPSGMFSTSADGLTFTTEQTTGFGKGQGVAEFPSADSFVMRLANGDVRMYFNWGDDKGGAIYTAHRPGFSLNGR